MNYTKEQYQTLLYVFHCVLSAAEAGCPLSKVTGICYNSQCFLLLKGSDSDSRLNCYEAVQEFSAGWPFHSGDWQYPVKTPEGFQVMQGDLWKGEQLTLRISLLEYMIAKLGDRLKAMED